MNYNDIEVVALTQKLVEIESSNPGVFEGAIGDFVFDWLSATGAVVVRDEVFPGRSNIVAYIEGEIKDPNLVYICHMDTVPIGEGWDHDPLKAEIIDGKIYGRGACDMKAGLAAGMVAFRNIVMAKKKPKYNFVFIASVDEEDIMYGAEKAVKSGWINKNSWVLDSEPTNGIIQVAHKGKTWFKLTTHGVAAHASTPWKGIDAIGAMAEIISSIRRRISECPPSNELGVSTVTFGTIQGGINTNIVPDECSVAIDMRLVPPITSEKSIQLVKDAIEEGLSKVEGATCDCVVTAKRPYIEKDDNSFLLARLKSACSKVMGDTPAVDFFPGYTDTAVVAAMTGNTNCMSFGPGDLALAHKPNEYVPCSEIIRSAEIMTVLAQSILFE